jgi:hypothetical protein
MHARGTSIARGFVAQRHEETNMKNVGSGSVVSVQNKRAWGGSWVGRGVVGLLALTAAATTSKAFAYVPDDVFIESIAHENETLRANNPELWNNNFSQPEDGPDGIPGADGTGDSLGAFVFYTGVNGDRGAIYASNNGNFIESYGLYGAIFASWAAAGYENGHGYPTSEELTAGANEVRWGCQSNDRAQWFWSYQVNSPYLACFHWDDGVTSWIVPIQR